MNADEWQLSEENNRDNSDDIVITVKCTSKRQTINKLMETLW